MDSPWDRLTRLLPPPAEPVAAVPWHRSRPEIGLDFPADYRRFVDHYGGGDVIALDFVSVWEPDETPMDVVSMTIYGPSDSDPPPFRDRGFPGVQQYQNEQIHPLFVDDDGTYVDQWDGPLYPVLPDPGGLLAWGDSEDGDIFFWLTEESDPDRWPVVMLARGPAVMHRFDCGMVEFLVSILSGDNADVTWYAWPRLGWKRRNDWLRRSGH